MGTLTVHQFHYTASHADAVTHHMRLIQKSLADIGIEGEIVVGKNPNQPGIRLFDEKALATADLLLLHHSHGNPLLDKVLSLPVPKALIYHNVTPAIFFGHDPHLARMSRLGRQQLPSLIEHCQCLFAVSEYNAAELRSLGAKSVATFPLIDLSSSSPAVLATGTPSTKQTLLFVGKLTPHKNQALLIQALFLLNQEHPTYQLVLVGREDPIYGRYLRLLTKALGMEASVKFTGAVSQNELENLYATSSAFVCASLHEGFCLPLVESMQRGLPVIALGGTGVSETLGYDERMQATPEAFARLIHETLTSPEKVEKLLESQETRLENFRQFQHAGRIQSICLALFDELRESKRFDSPEVYT